MITPEANPYRRLTRRALLLGATGALSALGLAACGGATPGARPGSTAASTASPAQAAPVTQPTESPAGLPTASPQTQSPSPEVAARTPAGPRPLEGYGFQAHLNNQDRSLIVRLTKEAGFDWLKQQVVWLYVEPDQKGTFDWRELDKVVRAVNEAGLKLLLSVVGAPRWALGDREHGPPGDPADLRDFMAAMAGRYNGKVRAYEIWNEANMAGEWGYGRINAGEFVELLRAGYEGVKAGDPAAIVVGGALTPAGDVDIPDQKIQAVDDVAYLRRMYEHNGGAVKSYFDAWGVHPGGFNKAPDQPFGSERGSGWSGHHSFYFLRFTEHRQIMEEFGDGEKPMWFTEFGWSTENLDPNYGYGKDNSEQDQAGFLVRAFDIVRKEHPYVSHMFVWNLNFQMVVPPTDEKYPFGVVYSDGSPRPAYQALKAMDKGR